MHQVGYRSRWHSEFEEDWPSSFPVRAPTRVSWDAPRVSAGYVPEVLEGCRSTWSKALPISTGLYSLVKVRQVEVMFLEQKVHKKSGFWNPCLKRSNPWFSEQKVVKMCGFRNPYPKRAIPWWELGQLFGPLFRALQAPTCLPLAKPWGKSIGNNADKKLPFYMHQVGYRSWMHSEFEEDWPSGFRARAPTGVSWDAPRVSAGVCSWGARAMVFHMK